MLRLIITLLLWSIGYILWPLVALVLSGILLMYQGETEDTTHAGKKLLLQFVIGILVGGGTLFVYFAGNTTALASGTTLYLVLGIWSYSTMPIERRNWRELALWLEYPLWCIIKAPNLWASNETLDHEDIPDPYKERIQIACALIGLIGAPIVALIAWWTGSVGLGSLSFILALVYATPTFAYHSLQREREAYPASGAHS
jgi:hypothetical protein